jgi:hypothetical protein
MQAALEHFNDKTRIHSNPVADKPVREKRLGPFLLLIVIAEIFAIFQVIEDINHGMGGNIIELGMFCLD